MQLHHQITILLHPPVTTNPLKNFAPLSSSLKGVRECISSQYCLNIAFDFDRSGLYKSMKSNNIQYLDTEIYKLYHDRLHCCCIPYWWWLQCAIEIGQVLDGGGFHLHFTALFDENCASPAQLPIDRSSLRHVVDVFLRFSQWGFPKYLLSFPQATLVSPYRLYLSLSRLVYHLLTTITREQRDDYTRWINWWLIVVYTAINKCIECVPRNVTCWRLVCPSLSSCIVVRLCGHQVKE